MVKPVSQAPNLDDIASFTVSGPAGEFVYKEGEAGNEMFIIQEGRIELLRLQDDLGQPGPVPQDQKVDGAESPDGVNPPFGQNGLADPGREVAIERSLRCCRANHAASLPSFSIVTCPAR